MGANSYIGNGPNFMIKRISEHYRYAMPSFFGYMGYAAVVLVPLYLLVTLIFFG
jgi:Na+/H+ antiporter NhaD/arsenite permease-like protein